MNNMINILIDLSNFGLLKINGLDAKKLLQGQLTCDIEEVTATQSRVGAHCNPQGRVISFFNIILFQDAYYLIVPRNMIAITMAALKKYAIFYKVELTDASKMLSVIGYIGPDKNKIVTPAVVKIPVGESRLVMISKPETIKDIWEPLLKNASIAAADKWKYEDICAGIPNIYPETSGKFLPHEINLHKFGAINFEKGCYTGQEIIARMHYRGKLKKHMCQAVIESQFPPLPGCDIDGGIVVDSVSERYNHYRVLIVIDKANVKIFSEC